MVVAALRVARQQYLEPFLAATPIVPAVPETARTGLDES
jgi:hypothetical protein